MSAGHADRKLANLTRTKLILLENPGIYTPTKLAEMVGVDRVSMHRYLKELGATANNQGEYTYIVGEDELRVARLLLLAARRQRQKARRNESSSD